MRIKDDETASQLDLQDCQTHLKLTVQYHKILGRILAKIRASINLESPCSTTCQDICLQLQIERVGIYRFNADWSGQKSKSAFEFGLLDF